MYNLWYFVAFYTVLLPNLFFLAIYAVLSHYRFFRFTHYYVEKNVVKNSARGEKWQIWGMLLPNGMPCCATLWIVQLHCLRSGLCSELCASRFCALELCSELCASGLTVCALQGIGAQICTWLRCLPNGCSPRARDQTERAWPGDIIMQPFPGDRKMQDSFQAWTKPVMQWWIGDEIKQKKHW